MRHWAKLLALIAATLGTTPLMAQEKATLIADQLEISNSNILVATGNVEVFQGAMKLSAQKLIYDSQLDRFLLEGPIVFDDGATVKVLASGAELSADFRDGLASTAKVIIDQNLQITASTFQRVQGRYNAMTNVAASSCQICQDGPPLWEIRAKQVVHDTTARQVYFKGAQFRMGGVPLAYFPRLRLADPTLKRATGFLTPKIEVTSTLGYTLKMPYFIAIGPHKDLTISPYSTSLGARGLDLRYRQAFSTGSITIDGAISEDSVLPGQLRGYVLALGSFSLPRGYTLNLRAETVSDGGYFSGYGLNEKDRLVTTLDITRANRAHFVKGRVLGFYSVRDSDVNATQPSQFADFEYQRRVPLAGGMLRYSVHANTRIRASDDPLDGSDADTAADGRDVRGYGLRGEWNRAFVMPMGILANTTLALRSDRYVVQQDTLYAGSYHRHAAAFATELRWPWIKSAQNSAVHTLEPIAQLVLAPAKADRLFNDDSALVEFDEGNLFAINRFPGSDRIETASRANLGMRYIYDGPNGARGQLALGRVISNSTQAQFSAASGLGQQRSDWLVAGQLDMNTTLGVTARSLWTHGGNLRKMELRGAVSGPKTGVSLGYLFAPADSDEARTATISEVTLYATQKLSTRWSGSLSARYDDISSKLSSSGLAMVYRNECLQLDLSLSRSFVSSTTVTPNTNFGLSIALLGFGGQSAGVAEQCRG